MEEQYIDYIKLAAVFLLALVSWFIARKFLLNAFHNFTEKSSASWDDYLTKHNVFKIATFLVPISILYSGFHYLGFATETLDLKVFLVLVIIVVMLILMGVVNAISDFYNSKSERFKFPVKGYVQIFQMIILIIGIILIFSILKEITLWKIISGLGAISAILIFLLKDTFVSLASSIHLLTHDMAKINDWVEVEEFNANGTIEDISLYNVKIRNWSNSIVNIPLAQFVNSTFINWQSIDDKKSRRMKRNLYIDIDTIHFCTDEELNSYQNNPLLASFIASEYYVNHPEPISNLHLYKNYIAYYLDKHPEVYSSGEKFSFLVNLLESTPHGLPIQVYVYTKTADWIKFESIQTEIFDHLIVMAKLFSLEHFQNISSSMKVHAV